MLRTDPQAAAVACVPVTTSHRGAAEAARSRCLRAQRALELAQRAVERAEDNEEIAQRALQRARDRLAGAMADFNEGGCGVRVVVVVWWCVCMCVCGGGGKLLAIAKGIHPPSLSPLPACTCLWPLACGCARGCMVVVPSEWAGPPRTSRVTLDVTLPILFPANPAPPLRSVRGQRQRRHPKLSGRLVGTRGAGVGSSVPVQRRVGMPLLAGSRGILCPSLVCPCSCSPSDAAKTAPGACGCGVADTDTDGDLTLDCNDGWCVV